MPDLALALCPIMQLISGSLFVRVRTRSSYAARTLLARCSYASRTSSHERELTREQRDAPLWRPQLGHAIVRVSLVKSQITENQIKTERNMKKAGLIPLILFFFLMALFF